MGRAQPDHPTARGRPWRHPHRCAHCQGTDGEHRALPQGREARLPHGDQRVKIVSVEDLHVSGGWDNWSFLKLTTDTGLVGWSEFNQARGRRGLAQVIRGLSELVVGEDPRNVGKLSARLYSATQ